ncbi:MAG: TRAP transporter large permease subunit [Desulfuromonadales bacterium]
MNNHSEEIPEVNLEKVSEFAPPEHLAVPERFALLDKVVKLVTEIPAALLVFAEILVLLAGVISRYVFNSPLTWTDELASILFLWLAMLGAVIALRRGEHMRLTAFVNMLPPIWRPWVENVAAMVAAVFIIQLAMPAFTYIEEQWMITTPALGMHDSFRVAALGVGVVLMMLITIVRFIENSSWKQVASALLIVAVAAGILWVAKPALLAIGNYNMLVYFIVIVAVAVAAGVPIAFAFGIATITYLTMVTDAPLTIVVSRMDEGMSTLVLLSVPLFVFLGFLLEMTGLAKVLVEFLGSLMGHVRGGLSYVLLGAMFIVSGISGSKAADMAAVAPVLFPEMKRRGSKPGELVALLSSSGAMGETIPPSLVIITIGSVCGISIAALFTGGILPAAFCALALAVVAFFRNRDENLDGVERASLATVVRKFLVALPAVALPIFILTAVVKGIATATEVSTLGVAYTVILGIFFYRRFDIKKIYPMLVETASLSGAILLIIGSATAMGWALAQSGFSKNLADIMSRVPGGQFGFLVVSIVLFIILGSVLEGIPAMVLFGPLLFPVARSLGVHEVHYAIVIIMSMGIGLFAPPLGVGYYAACAIGKVSPDEAMRPVWLYLGALFIAVLFLAAFPWLSIVFL